MSRLNDIAKRISSRERLQKNYILLGNSSANSEAQKLDIL